MITKSAWGVDITWPANSKRVATARKQKGEKSHQYQHGTLAAFVMVGVYRIDWPLSWLSREKQTLQHNGSTQRLQTFGSRSLGSWLIS
jgi:hypothetical protein